MRAVRLLWIDLCSQSAGRLADQVPADYETTRISRFDCALTAVRRSRPDATCIEFDYPDRLRLQVVTAVKRAFPDLPLLMLTEHHSEALAVWAFRSGVWDYRVKPIDDDALVRVLSALAYHAHDPAGRALRAPLPCDLIEPAGHLQRPPTATPKTAAAVACITKYFSENLSRSALASLCHLSPSEFSRAFRREQGITFERFLIAYRIAKARDLLAEPGATVSHVAYATGFNDPAYFSRAFRRMVGITASDYQKHAQPTMGAACTDARDSARSSISSAG